MSTENQRPTVNNRAYELVDNNRFGRHHDALNALATQHGLPISIATGFINLDGLDALAAMARNAGVPTRLMIGAAPSPNELAGEPDKRIIDRFDESLKNLRGERDFEAFPKERRDKLERVAAFIESEQVEVRRYVARFLHGKAYIFSEHEGPSPMGASLVSSANLTGAGLNSNLELGMVQYQPNVVGMTLEWYRDLWEDAEDYKDDLLDLLEPDIPETDPDTVFLRALYEYYGDDFEDQVSIDPTELTSFQRDGYRRARRILDQYDGVLYADGVGMGKTEIGVEFVREFMREQGQQVLIIAPAQLRDNLWKQRLATANLRTDIVSFQQLANDRQVSRGGTAHVLPVSKDVYRLVVIDEAHAYRNADNSWYDALDRLMSGTRKKLLMLTATPVNNSLWDLHNLFLLFARHDGAFADAPLRIPSLRNFFREAGASDSERISEPRMFPLIDALTVRRDRRFVMDQYPNESFADGTRVKFPQPKLIEQRYDLDDAYPGLVKQIAKDIDGLKMARYRPDAYLIGGEEKASQTAIAGFMQSMLLKRFESSWFAALQTVRRMTEAHHKILTAIEQTGQVPIGDALQEVQLNADQSIILQEELFEGEHSLGRFIPTENFIDSFFEHLEKDLALLEDIETRLSDLEGRPDPKLETLKQVMQSTPSQKVAIFSSFGDTVNYLRDQIEADVTILGNREYEAVVGGESDPNQRARVVEQFCPSAESEDRALSKSNAPEIDVLLSTDVLSEGQNLQQAQSVLSYDMPWNPQRVVQRNGRVIRLKSPHDVAYLYTLLPKQGELEDLLRLEANIEAKIIAANASIGMESPVLQGPETESRIFADLQSFTRRLAEGDTTLLDESSGAASAGEIFRSELARAQSEGDLQRIKDLPWGIGAAFVPKSSNLTEPAVFFACRTRNDERYWRMVTLSGELMDVQDLEMMFHINPQNAPGCDIPSDIDFNQLFAIAAESIVQDHNKLTDPVALEGSVPASQRWALEILRSPDAPEGQAYDDADAALSVGRNQRVIRALSRVRSQHLETGIIEETANGILEIVKEFGLSPVEPPTPPQPISTDDVAVVCYQVVLPENADQRDHSNHINHT